MCIPVPALPLLVLSLALPAGDFLVEGRRLVGGPCCGFGNSVAGLGDVDGDGVPDLAVGAPLNTALTGMVWIQFLTPSGVPRATQGINNVLGGLGNCLTVGDVFGAAVAAIGDLDGDGLSELAVGAPGDDEAAQTGGAVYVLFLRRDGTVDHKQKLTSSYGSFGIALAGIGDVDGDGILDLAVGAHGDSNAVGSVFVVFLNADGTERSRVRNGDAAVGGGLDAVDYFGTAVASLGDLDGDGVVDLAAGARLDDDGGTNRGAVWILFLQTNGRVKSWQKVSAFAGGFRGRLDDQDWFGRSLLAPGDLDGDGTLELAVGASGDDDRGADRGAVWILSLDARGLVTAQRKWSSANVLGPLGDGDEFGTALASAGDLDGSGLPELTLGSDDGSALLYLFLGPAPDLAWSSIASGQAERPAEPPPPHAVKLALQSGGFGGGLSDFDHFGASLAGLGLHDRDGLPDLAVGAPDRDDGGSDRGAVFLLFLGFDGTVRSKRKLADSAGGFVGPLSNGDRFGASLAALGDLDGDGSGDLAVGASGDDDGSTDAGAVWIVFLDPTGSRLAESKLSATSGSFGGSLAPGDGFGGALAFLGDLDGDGVGELAVGASGDDDGALDAGAVWILFLDPAGNVRTQAKISAASGGFLGQLDAGDRFGGALAAAGDLDGDGVGDVCVGAPGDDDAARDAGAVWILLLDPAGGVRAEQEISAGTGGFAGPLRPLDGFGSSLARIGDRGSNGLVELAVGAPGDDAGGANRGALWILGLDAAGLVGSGLRIDSTFPDLDAGLDDFDRFGVSAALVGDIDRDGTLELAAGADLDDTGRLDVGATWIVFSGVQPLVSTDAYSGPGSRRK